VRSESELAGRQGFEPRFCGSEPHVLPLNDLPVEDGRVGYKIGHRRSTHGRQAAKTARAPGLNLLRRSEVEVVCLWIEGEADAVEEAGVAEEGEADGPVAADEEDALRVQGIALAGNQGNRQA